MAADEGTTRRRANELGPTGQAVAVNVARIRNALGMSTYRLSEILADLGRPIAASAISKIEGGTRRVDTDDLMALAVAFDVPPAAILLPPVAEGRMALLDGYEDEAAKIWNWAESSWPLRVPAEDDGEYWNAWQSRSKPPGRRQFRATGAVPATATVRVGRPAAEESRSASRQFFEETAAKNKARRDEDAPPAE
jgi:transcriptional regulator with XRE-family HTH domain